MVFVYENVHVLMPFDKFLSVHVKSYRMQFLVLCKGSCIKCKGSCIKWFLFVAVISNLG